MRQPPKSLLREQLAATVDENIRLRAEVERLRSAWWRRFLNTIRNWRRAPKDIA